MKKTGRVEYARKNGIKISGNIKDVREIIWIDLIQMLIGWFVKLILFLFVGKIFAFYIADVLLYGAINLFV